MHLQIDAVGGIAGDMFIAACLDAWPESADDTLMAIRAAGLPVDWTLALDDHHDSVLRGRRFTVREPSPMTGAEHVPLRDIVRGLSQSPLAPAVRDRAIAIFQVLAVAEADVHGIAVDDVEFHEVGAWDSIADIVGAAHLIETLRPSSWSVGPIPLGGGRIRTAHGAMPVPAPATAILLQGFELIDDGIDGERVTPTGAAILQHLRSTLGEPVRGMLRPMTLQRNGTGFGTRTLPGLSNVLRVLIFDEPVTVRAQDWVAVIEFEVDDQTSEDLALGIDALRGRPGVLDVLQMPCVGKKGRMIAHVQVLCRRDALPQAIDACFLETTTIGLRWRLSARAKLEREQYAVDAGNRAVSVKIAQRPEERVTAKTDSDDVAGAAGHAERAARRQAAEAYALHHHGRRDR